VRHDHSLRTECSVSCRTWCELDRNVSGKYSPSKGRTHPHRLVERPQSLLLVVSGPLRCDLPRQPCSHPSLDGTRSRELLPLAKANVLRCRRYGGRSPLSHENRPESATPHHVRSATQGQERPNPAGRDPTLGCALPKETFRACLTGLSPGCTPTQIPGPVPQFPTACASLDSGRDRPRTELLGCPFVPP
jgi:hypothetical protein